MWGNGKAAHLVIEYALISSVKVKIQVRNSIM